MTSVAELKDQMEDERRDLSRNLTELKTRAESALDWRDQVKKHPALMAGAALGAGVLLAQLHRGRPRAAGMNTALLHDDDARPRRPGIIDGLGETLVATAATAVAGMLADFIPGFREEHDKRRR